jgi:hypothetical protein
MDFLVTDWSAQADKRFETISRHSEKCGHASWLFEHANEVVWWCLESSPGVALVGDEPICDTLKEIKYILSK